MTCSRCMRDVLLPLHITVRQRFAPEQNPDGDPAETEDDVVRFNGYRIDLQETVAEEVRLAIPMKVLCREDCKGCAVLRQRFERGALWLPPRGDGSPLGRFERLIALESR